MNLNHWIIGILFFLILSGCISDYERKNELLSRQIDELLQKPQRQGLTHAFELQVFNREGKVIDKANIDYYTANKAKYNDGKQSHTIDLGKIEDGRLITDKDGIATKVFNKDKYLLQLYGGLSSDHITIYYKIEYEGYKPIIGEQEIMASSDGKIAKRIVIDKINPTTNIIEGGITFSENKLPTNFNGSNISQVVSYEPNGLGSMSDTTAEGTVHGWYDMNKHIEMYQRYAKEKEPVAANKIYAFKIDDNSIIKTNNTIKIMGKDKKYKVRNWSADKSYIGQNFLGVKANVREHREMNYNVYPINIDNRLKETISLEVPSIYSGNDNIGILFICKPFRYNNKYNYTATSGVNKEPTIPDPSGFAVFNTSLYIELYEIWIYDKQSGVILIKNKYYGA